MEDEQINTGYVETEPVDEYLVNVIDNGSIFSELAEPYSDSLVYNDSNYKVERFDYDNFNASDASKLVDSYVAIQYNNIIDTIRDVSKYQGLREVQFDILPENIIKLKNKGFLVKNGVITW